MSFLEKVKHLQIPLQDIYLATSNFSENNFIASGGFGKVYHGESNKHGMVAIKRLDRKLGQGDREFLMEIALLSTYKHENIVSLVGFCTQDEEKILVYKHERNGSLDKYLHREDLTWIQRLQICLDAAHGLKYLHEDVGPQHRIIHRDIKSSNILLDENWRAKISDFGLSKVGPANVQHTFLVSQVCGTIGYIDPEYLNTGVLTKESDVYSFGVVLFEVLCGRLAHVMDESQYLNTLAQIHYEKETLVELIPSDFLKQINTASLSTFSTIAYKCLRKRRQDRPPMTQVVEELEEALNYQLKASGSGPVVHNFGEHGEQKSWYYEVFLSFRGEDTSKTFVDHLYTSLVQHGIHTYKDDETLPRGESISIGPSLLEAILESRIAVIVFSENYADSSWCLDELEYIMECWGTRGQTVLPVFYDVDPSDVRKQKGKYGKAFAKHELENNHKVESWKTALAAAGNLSGWVTKDYANGHEAKCIKEIVGLISSMLISKVSKDLIGIETRLQDLKSKLEFGSSGDVRIVGIWGVGGGGKTTLASAAYTEMSEHFEGRCFLENIREESSRHGLMMLQKNMLSCVLKIEVMVTSVEEGRSIIKRRLCNRKLLVVLDDVDDLKQLEALAGSHDWFGEGSRIIITTRYKHLLNRKADSVYGVSLLSHDESMKLFRAHAYREDKPVEDYEILSEKVVSYAGGLPLALKVLGNFLYDKDKDEWKSALAKLKDIPDHDVMERLKITYDGV